MLWILGLLYIFRTIFFTYIFKFYNIQYMLIVQQHLLINGWHTSASREGLGVFWGGVGDRVWGCGRAVECISI